MTAPSSRVQQARALASVDEARTFYDGWAEQYDDDIYGSLAFIGTDRLVTLTVELVPATAIVLDAGCGTGAVGERLRAHGFAAIDGIDLSPGMLDVAATKGVYRTLTPCDMTGPLPLPDSSYDAVVSAGTFVSGHVTADALGELVRITVPSGVVVFTVMATFWEPGRFATVIAALVTNGFVEVIHDRIVPVTSDGSSEARLVAFRRL